MMMTVKFPILLLLITFGIASAQEDFRTLHRSATVVDGHNDILGRVMSGGEMESWNARGHSDLPRFQAGGLDVQVFSIWVPSREKGDAAWQFALAEIDSLWAIARRNPSKLEIVTTAAKLQSAVNTRKIAGIIGLEGGRCIDGKQERILALYRRGLRSFGLTWNYSSDWATCSKDEAAGKVKGGLSAKGKDFVRLLDSLGVLIDVSHLGERSFWDVINTSKNPIIASHSACKALREHHRNLTDAQFRAIAKNGGVVMINFFPGFLISGLNDARIKRSKAMAEEHMLLKKKYPARDETYLKAVDKLIARAETQKLATLRTLADHIDHAVRIAGIEHVGLGSDFDGIGFTPVGLADVTDLPLLTRELRRRGYSHAACRNILGENFHRVFAKVCDQ